MTCELRTSIARTSAMRQLPKSYLLILSASLAQGAGAAWSEPPLVPCAAETEPVRTTDDAADDAAIWVHPSDPAKSLIIWTDKKAGLVVSDLSGATRQELKRGRPNNVDVVQATADVALVVASDRADNTVAIYTLDPSSGVLRHSEADSFATGLDEVYGLCAYRDPVRQVATVVVASKRGVVRMYELTRRQGTWTSAQTREFTVGGQIEGMVADPERGFLYVGEEQVGLWQYALDPGVEPARRLIDCVGAKGGGIAGNLAADVEGVTLYDAGGGQGWIIVSCQGEDRYAAYDRVSLDYRGSFGLEFVRPDGTRDRVTHTDGIHATSAALGPRFPRGIFIAQDDNNGSPQNFKMASWASIERALAPSASNP
jgi:3-phytase